jgi:hypothetical protein
MRKVETKRAKAPQRKCANGNACKRAGAFGLVSMAGTPLAAPAMPAWRPSGQGAANRACYKKCSCLRPLRLGWHLFLVLIFWHIGKFLL